MCSPHTFITTRMAVTPLHVTGGPTPHHQPHACTLLRLHLTRLHSLLVALLHFTQDKLDPCLRTPSYLANPLHPHTRCVPCYTPHAVPTCAPPRIHPSSSLQPLLSVAVFCHSLSSPSFLAREAAGEEERRGRDSSFLPLPHYLGANARCPSSPSSSVVDRVRLSFSFRVVCGCFLAWGGWFSGLPGKVTSERH